MATVRKLIGNVRGPQGVQGPQGIQGIQGPTGPTGPTGPVGPTPNITIGTVEDVPHDSQASATITGTPENPVLNLRLRSGAGGNETIDDTAGIGDTDLVWSADKTAKETDKKINREYEIGFVEKTWNGLTDFDSHGIWRDGNNVYYSYGSDQYVLDKSTSTWSPKTWNGLSNFDASNVWYDGDNTYYSDRTNQYILDKSTSTWSPKTWNGLNSFYGYDVWTDGENVYYSNRTDQYVLNRSTSTWSTKTWNGLTDFSGEWSWTDGENIYYDNGSTYYVLDKATSTWNVKVWNGLDEVARADVWTDGENIYYSHRDYTQQIHHYVLDKATSTWYTKAWPEPTDFIGMNIWTDGKNVYYSRTPIHYVLKDDQFLLIGKHGSFKSKTAESFIKDTVINDTAGAGDTHKAWSADKTLSELNKKADPIYKTINTPSAIVSFNDGADDLSIKEMRIAIEPVQAGSGTVSTANVRNITGWTGCNITVSGDEDSVAYPITFPTEAGTVYGGELTIFKDGSAQLVVDRMILNYDGQMKQVDGSLVPEGWALNVSMNSGEYNYFSNTYKGAERFINSSEKRPICNEMQATIIEFDRLVLGISIVNNQDILIRYSSDNTLNVSDLETWLGQHPLQIVAWLTDASKKTYTFTASQVLTILGNNSIQADTGSINLLTYPVDSTIAHAETQQEFSSLISLKGQPNGIAELDAEGIVPVDQLPPIASPVDMETTVENSATLTLTDAIDFAALHGVRAKVLPRQPLGGYDKPWGPGKGRNKLDPSQYSGATSYGVNFSKDSDGNLSIYGTSRVIGETKLGEVTLPAGNYILCTNCALDAGVMLRNSSGGTMIAESYGAMGHYFSIGAQTKFYLYGIFKSIRFYNAKINPMILLDQSDRDYEKWEPYSNICPITEMSAGAPTLTASGNAPWGFVGSNVGIYGCEVEGVPGGSGVLRVTHKSIASYAGEMLNGRWWSSYEFYADGTTPTTGAQVVYELAEPEEITITVSEMRVSSPHKLKVSWPCTELWAKYEGKTQKYIDKAIDKKADAAYKTIDTPASIITIDDGADDLPIKELKFTIEPVQDLHGYDAPGPVGDIINKLPAPKDETKTLNGITITVKDGVYTVNGTATKTAAFDFQLNGSVDLSPSTNKIAFLNSVASDSVSVRFRRSGVNVHSWMMSTQNIVKSGWPDSGNEVIDTVTISVSSGATVNMTISPMLIALTDSDPTTFSPYCNICPITGRTGAKVTRTWKNLIPSSAITRPSTSRIRAWYDGIGTTLKKGTYTFSCTYRNISGLYINRYVNGSNSTIFTKDYSNSITFTLDEDTDGINLSALLNDGDLSDYAIQLEFGSTATAYEPSQCEIYDISFPSDAGTVYGGELTIHADGTGELVVDRGLWNLDGTEDWVITTASSGRRFQLSVSNLAGMAGAGNASNVLSDKFVWSETANNSFGHIRLISNYLNLCDNGSIFANAAELKAWLAKNRAQVLAPLATISTYQLSTPQVRTLLGLNHIFADVGDIESITYPVDTTTALDNQTTTIHGMIAESDSPVAAESHAVGDVFICDNKLYKATDAIAIGESVIEGSNVAQTSVAELLLNKPNFVFNAAVVKDHPVSVTLSNQSRAIVFATGADAERVALISLYSSSIRAFAWDIYASEQLTATINGTTVTLAYSGAGSCFIDILKLNGDVTATMT